MIRNINTELEIRAITNKLIKDATKVAPIITGVMQLDCVAQRATLHG